MRKYIALVLTLVCVLALVGCEKNDTYKIRITIPAGSTEAFVYSDEEISATGKKITISSGEGLGDTEVVLSPVNEIYTCNPERKTTSKSKVLLFISH